MVLINPGQHPAIPIGSSGAAAAELRWEHNEKYDEFQKYINIEKALKLQLISAIDKTYIRVKRNKFVGYANITMLNLLKYLYEGYARITLGDLKENDKHMNQPYDINEPIEVLFD